MAATIMLDSTPKRNRFQKWLTVVCLFLMTIPTGVMWYWGNLSVYLNSYILKRVDINSDVFAPWTMSFAEMGTCAGLLVSSYLCKSLGKRPTLVLGYALIIGGFVASYFTIDVSGIGTKLLIGFVTGSGMYMSNGVIMLITSEWSDNDFGFLNSIVQCGRTIGAIAVNQFITLYINPYNYSPDFYHGPSKFFSQNSVLDNVPKTFPILAAIVFGMFIINFPFIRYNSKNSKVEDNDAEQQFIISNEYSSYEGVKIKDKFNDKIKTTQEISSATRQSFLKSLKDLIRQPALYVLAVFMVIGCTTYIIVTNYYKQYGQMYIDDDHFLTNMSITYPIVLTISRLVWGKISDRYGIKTSVIVFFSSNGLATLGFYFSPWFGKWSYVFWTHIFFATGNAVYLICACACVKVFGEDNLILSYGLISLPPGAIVLFITRLCQYLIEQFGWFALYAFSSSSNVLGLILCIITIPEHL